MRIVGIIIIARTSEEASAAPPTSRFLGTYRAAHANELGAKLVCQAVFPCEISRYSRRRQWPTNTRASRAFPPSSSLESVLLGIVNRSGANVWILDSFVKRIEAIYACRALSEWGFFFLE